MDLSLVNHYVYAYSTMLLQLSAQYNDPTLKEAILEIVALYELMSKEVESGNVNQNDLTQSIHKLNLCVLNIHISVINNNYKDLVPICDALGALVSNISAQEDAHA